MTDTPLGILAQRRIEAGVIKPIYEAMVAEIGIEAAQRILGAAIRTAAVSAGAAFAAKTPDGTSMESFVALQSLWTADDALQIEVIEAGDTVFSYNVHRCRYAEMYRDMGLGDIGHLLSCNRDGTFCEGYDKRLKLQRTQTLMSGASHCDFRYTLEAPPESP